MNTKRVRLHGGPKHGEIMMVHDSIIVLGYLSVIEKDFANLTDFITEDPEAEITTRQGRYTKVGNRAGRDGIWDYEWIGSL